MFFFFRHKFSWMWALIGEHESFQGNHVQGGIKMAVRMKEVENQTNPHRCKISIKKRINSLCDLAHSPLSLSRLMETRNDPRGWTFTICDKMAYYVNSMVSMVLVYSLSPLSYGITHLDGVCIASPQSQRNYVCAGNPWICSLNIWIMFVCLRSKRCTVHTVYSVCEMFVRRYLRDNTAYQPMPSHNKFTHEKQVNVRLKVLEDERNECGAGRSKAATPPYKLLFSLLNVYFSSLFCKPYWLCSCIVFLSSSSSAASSSASSS